MIYLRNWKLSIRKDKLRHQEMSKNSANNQLAGLQMVLRSRLAREHCVNYAVAKFLLGFISVLDSLPGKALCHLILGDQM